MEPQDPRRRAGCLILAAIFALAWFMLYLATAPAQ